jgi:hypothetical protein
LLRNSENPRHFRTTLRCLCASMSGL